MGTEAAKTTTLRLRRIRFKSGGEIRVLPPSRSPIAGRFADTAEKLKADKDFGPQMAGFLLIAWSTTGFTYVDWENSGTQVSTGDIPRYAHDTMLVKLAQTWGNRDD